MTHDQSPCGRINRSAAAERDPLHVSSFILFIYLSLSHPPVVVDDRVQPVRDAQDRAVAELFSHGGLDQNVRFGVDLVGFRRTAGGWDGWCCW